MKKILFLCLSCCCSIILIAQCIEINQCVTGLSFEDFNCNGINDTEPGVQGVVVKVYDSNNQLAAIDTTDVQGAWQACGLIDANQYRVEFILPENIAAWANPTHTGLDNGSNVQFVTVPTCANFGLSNPSDYCNLNNLRMGTTCFVNGDNNNDKETFVTFDYNAAGPSVNGNLESMATDAQIGAVWGLAYNIPKHRVYVSAVERRHTGYTNNGPGAIFQIDITDPINPVVTHFINISNPGADQHQDLATGGANLIPSRDANSFFNVGKLSIGDIDISNDGNTLWAMNLNTRSLVEIAVPTATEIATYSIPGTLCNDINEVRPWAIKVHKNKVYVGVVCSGENDGDFEAHVLELQDDGTFLVVTTVDLGYPKEEVWTYTGNGCNYVGPSAWKPWNDTWPTVNCTNPFGNNDNYLEGNEQPILADIEFDVDGSLVLGFADRFAMQSGVRNYSPFETTNTTYYPYSGGDILRICTINGSYEQESIGGVLVGFMAILSIIQPIILLLAMYNIKRWH